MIPVSSLRWRALLAAAFLASSSPAHAAGRDVDVVYGHKLGMALTMDVFRPDTPNGFGVVVPVSGAWQSSRQAMSLEQTDPFTSRGYTVFAVLHGSSPRFTISEAIADVERAIRFIRHHAARYAVDPNRLGMSGVSSGCHLSLMVAVRGSDGAPAALDAVERESSAVQAVGCFFPLTDFLNYSKPGEDAVGVGPLARFKPAFGPRAETPEGRRELGRVISPIYAVSPRTPPVLLLHGDADPLVPIYQSEQFVKRCEEAGVKAKLVRREGQGHGWANMHGGDARLFVEWFDEHLRGIATGGDG